jgi:hypothetical protein
LLLANGKLYTGGLFNRINNVQRLHLAAVSPVTGALDATWRPQANWAVNGLAVVPGTSLIALGGEFATINAQPRTYLASVDATTGAVSGWAPAPQCINATNPCIIRAVLASASLIYAAVGGPGGRVSAYSLATGAVVWSQYGDGDVQTIAMIGGTIFGGGHYDPQFGTHNGITQTRHEIAAMDATTGKLLPFAPIVAGATGIWAILADADGLRIGGSFTSVNGDTARRGFVAFPTAPAPLALVPAGATWSYRDSGSDPGTTWTAPTFNASAWPRGVGQFGFGDGDEATKLATGKVTYYFRNAFTVPAGVTPSALQLEVIRDDGAIVYLNGAEVWRDNMPAGPITAATPAKAALGGAAESDWNAVTIPASALRAGANVISVEIHNAAAPSSDVSMDLRLTTS